MKVHNPNNLPTIDYRKVKPLQGQLKDLTEENYAKLKKAIETDGFIAPLFIWESGGNHYLIDGHQRHRVITSENYQPYELPYLLIEATDEADAKKKLLRISSQYGTITQEGYDEFTADLPEPELIETVNFDALRQQSSSKIEDENQDTCPECGQKIKSGKKQV